MDYERAPNGAIHSIVQSDGIDLIYQAANVRNERTGVHATISIGFRERGRGAIPLDEDTYNVGRREERERLVNAIYKKEAMKAILTANGYDSARMSMDLMLFQRGLWQFEIGSQEAERRGGANERTYKQFVINPFVVEGGGTIIFAPPGRGKSWLGMLFCITVDAGISTFWPVKQGPALFVNLERSAESVDVRLGDINQALGLPRTRPLLRLDRRGRSLPDVIDGIQRTVEREGVSFVLVDSLSRMGYGNLIDNDPANKAMDALNSLSPAAWAVLAHTPRGDETHTFGSQMFDAAADVTVQLMTDDKSRGDTLGIGLRVDKANDIRKDTAFTQIALVFDQYGLTMVRKAKPNEFVEISAQKKQSTSEQVEEYLRLFGAADAGTIATGLGLDRSTVTKVLGTERFAQASKDGRKILFDLAESVHNEVWRGEDVHSLIETTPDSTPTHNNEVVGVQSTFNEEEGSVTVPEYRESQVTVRYVQQEEAIF
jgi:hypothetical protein